ARQAQFDRCGAMDRRGPNCEDVLAAPDLVKDPLPYREVQGSKSYGFNLDGTPDGHATATTCSHQKFVSPDGTKGVDNQYYRLLGCQKIVHTDLLTPEANRGGIVGTRNGRTLLEIRGVVDPRNDPRVDVVLYHGKDPLVADADGKAVPGQSQRIDGDVPAQY